MKTIFYLICSAFIFINAITYSQANINFLNPTNGSSETTYFSFSHNYTTSGDPDISSVWSTLHTLTTTYDSRNGNWPQSFTLSSGSYTWTLKLHEYHIGTGEVITATSTISFYVKNTIYLNYNFGSGDIDVDGIGKTVPTHVYKLSGSSLNLGAKDQADASGYSRVWNLSGTNDSKWTREGNYLSNSKNYSHGVTNVDNGKTIEAEMRKVCEVNYKATLDGTSSSISMEVNGSSTSTPTIDYDVVEQNEIYAHATSSFYQDDIYYVFQKWTWPSGQYAHSTTLSYYPTEHKEITAVYEGYPAWYSVARNLYTNTYNPRFPDTHVKLYWNEHPNTSVTQYKIYRKVNGGAETLMASVNRGTTTWTDPNYSVRNSGGVDQLQYDVRAYYSVNGNYSAPWFIYAWGEIGGASKEMVAQEEDMIIEDYAISNFPNPFNPTTKINYQLPEQGHVTIKVYDMLGKEVAELVNETKESGIYIAEFNASNLSSGVYVYTIQVDAMNEASKGYFMSKKMLMVK